MGTLFKHELRGVEAFRGEDKQQWQEMGEVRQVQEDFRVEGREHEQLEVPPHE